MIHSANQTGNPYIKKGFLFDTELVPVSRHSTVDLTLRYNNRIRVKNAPASWTSYSPGYSKEVDGVPVMIITTLDVLETPKVDFLIREELKLSSNEQKKLREE